MIDRVIGRVMNGVMDRVIDKQIDGEYVCMCVDTKLAFRWPEVVSTGFRIQTTFIEWNLFVIQTRMNVVITTQ